MAANAFAGRPSRDRCPFSFAKPSGRDRSVPPSYWWFSVSITAAERSPKFLAEALREQCEGRGPNSILFGDGEKYLRTPTWKDGWYVMAKKRAQKADPTFPLKLTIHDLRHTAASLAVSSGAHVKQVQGMLGHASAAMTLDTYSDLFESDVDGVGNALDEAYGDVMNAPAPVTILANSLPKARNRRVG